MRDRPLAVQVFPNGIDEQGYFMKQVPEHFPAWIARATTPVAVPIYWAELDDAKLKPDRWTVRTTPDRLAREGDAWRGMARHARILPNAPSL